MSDTAGNHEEAVRVLQAASAQIELALHQSQAPIDSLGESLRRLAALMADPAQLERPESLAMMRADLLRAITNLQFHDRMTQHLQHVRDYLSGSATHMAEQDADEEAWRRLHNRLHDRLLSETQRMHLGQDFLLSVLAREHQQRDSANAPVPRGLC
ncbi:MAG: hypothetical protein IPH71_12910 [Proteobacteria bacterium]|nr:hypothetical protein [Pseudomonadota bacterium]